MLTDDQLHQRAHAAASEWEHGHDFGVAAIIEAELRRVRDECSTAPRPMTAEEIEQALDKNCHSSTWGEGSREVVRSMMRLAVGLSPAREPDLKEKAWAEFLRVGRYGDIEKGGFTWDAFQLAYDAGRKSVQA